MTLQKAKDISSDDDEEEVEKQSSQESGSIPF